MGLVQSTNGPGKLKKQKNDSSAASGDQVGNKKKQYVLLDCQKTTRITTLIIRHSSILQVNMFIVKKMSKVAHSYNH